LTNNNKGSAFNIEAEVIVVTTNEFNVLVDYEEDTFSFSVSYARNDNVIVFNDEGDLTRGTVFGSVISVAVEG
tara:strand:- start:737 stop:955 length:219 start_codon:yes stop_codon:yes gene_type:complete